MSSDDTSNVGAQGSLSRRNFLAAGAGAAVATGLLADPLLAGTRAEAASNTLTVANFDVPTSVDPDGVAIGHDPSAEAIVNSFESLIRYRFKKNADGEFEPNFEAYSGRLARAWTASKDKRTYTFQLRRDAGSAWGNEFTADDYMWSMDRAFGRNSYGLFFLNVSGITDRNQIEKLDQYTIRFRLKEANALFLHARHSFLPPIFDSTEVRKHVTADDPWAVEWIKRWGGGFGPFMLDDVVPAQQAVMKANENYVIDGQPRIKTITTRAVPDAATRAAALTSGAVDVAEFLTPRLIKSLESKKGVKINHVLPGSRNQWMIINTLRGPLTDKRVRQAIAYAVPYDDIIKTVFYGRAVKYRAQVPLGYPNVNPKFWHYDTNLAKAKALLKQAGYPRGFKVVITYSSAVEYDEASAVLIRDSLRQIGIKVTLDKVTPAIFGTRKNDPKTKQEKSQIILSSTEIPYLPDFTFASIFFFYKGGFIPVWQSNTYDRLHQQQIRMTNPVARRKVIDRMQQILMDEMPNIGIVQTGLPFPARANVQGYHWLPENFTRYADVYKT